MNCNYISIKLCLLLNIFTTWSTWNFYLQLQVTIKISDSVPNYQPYKLIISIFFLQNGYFGYDEILGSDYKFYSHFVYLSVCALFLFCMDRQVKPQTWSGSDLIWSNQTWSQPDLITTWLDQTWLDHNLTWSAMSWLF